MKIVVAPNSFKDCMSSLEVANCIEKGLEKVLPIAKIEKIPLADGGDGTLEVIREHKCTRAQDCESYKRKIAGPLWDKIEAEYLIMEDTVVIELAKVAGLSLLPKERFKSSKVKGVKGSMVHLRNPMNTTTYGVGELIKTIVEKGINKIILGVGGSATCDGGTGILAALGVKFLDESGNNFIPVGITLNKIKEICMGEVTSPIPEIIVLADVLNPLVGPDGAAKVYAGQKGASHKEIEILENGLTHFSEVVDMVDLSKKPWMGASGGVPFGLSVIGAEVVGGAKFIMELLDFEERVSDADVIITGEGEINKNTRYGKVVWEVMQFGKTHKIPVIGITGSIGEGIDGFYKEGLSSVFSLMEGPISVAESISDACGFLEDVAFQVGKSF